MTMTTTRAGLAVLVGALPGAAGCGAVEALRGGSRGETFTLQATEDMPAARGSVTVRGEPGANQTVEVKVRHLAEPARISQGASAYVVWLVPEGGGPPRNLGVLRLGKNLEGTLKAQTPFREFEVFITPEPGPQAVEPTSKRILQASVRMSRAVR